MKKLLALVLVMVLALASLTSCDPKEKVVGGFNKVKETVGGWFGIEFEDEKKDDQTPDTPANPDTPVKENYAKMAINFVNTLYGEVDAKTPTNYDLVSKYTVPGTDVTLTIVWTVNVDTITIADSATEGNVTVTLPEAPATDINYTITATVTDANGNTETKSFDRVVPSVNNFMTPEEYYAAEAKASVIVKGIVTGIASKSLGAENNELYLNDASAKGGYYVYQLAKDPIADLNIAIGMTLKVTGTKDIYYGTHEIKDATVEILDSNITAVTPVDYTDLYLNASALTDKSLTQCGGLLVTLKGVEITSQGSNGYYKFLLGDKESYVRISSSTVCLNKDEIETFKANHTNNKGKLADVVGVVSVYNSAFYIVPVSVDAYSNFRDASRTPEDKVNYELDNLNIPTSIKKDETVDLALAGSVYADVVISWASNNACAVVSDDGKTVTFTLGDEAQTVTLTATATLGDVTLTKEITVKVAAKSKFVVTPVTTPVVGTAYKLYLYQGNLKKDLFFNGKMDGYYYATTGDIAQSIDVYLEATTGGYYLCGTTDKGKMYFNIVSSYDSEQAKIFNNVTIDFDPITVYQFDTDLNTLVATTSCVDGEGKTVTKTFVFGTRTDKNYETISASESKYVSTTFIAYLATVTNIDDLSDADKVAMEKDKLDVDTKVTEDTEIVLPNATLAGVTVEWTAEGAEIKDGKLVITLGSEAKTVTLTATIKAGEATDTKTFTFEVPKKIEGGIKADLDTIPIDTGYTADKSSVDGWILIKGASDNTQLGHHIVIINGKIGSVGSLTSPTLAGGLTKIAFNYTNVYNEQNGVDITIEILQNGQVVVSDKLDNDSVTQKETYNYSWVLTTPISGEYQIRIVNNSPSNHSGSGNKDRVAIWNLTYFPAEEVVVPEVTDEEMVNAELGNVKFDVTEVSNNTTITLPVPQKYADKVTFNWISDNACAVVADGKLVITLPADDVTVTLTLEVACGTVKETKTFEIKVTIPTLIITDVTTPVADKAYKLYFFQGALNKGLFMDGGIGSKNYYLSSTADLTKSVDAYLVAVEGGYNLKIVTAAGETKYINIVKSGSYTNSLIEDAPTTVYTFNAELHTLVATLDGADWIIATDNKYDTVSAKKTTYTGLYIVRLVEYTCKHEYTTDCDTVCDVCAATRETTVEHTFADDCDEVCDCGATRTAPHKYTSDCDTTCDCGATREPVGEHTYTADCDTVCDVCAATRTATAEHVDAAEDGICDVCNGSMAEVEKALIEAAKAEAKLAATYEKSVQFTLTEKVGRVTIAWVSSSDAIVINGNVVTIKLGAEAKEAVVTATYKCGATTETVEYKLALAKAPTLDHMEVIAPEANKAYKLYFFQASEQYNKGYYLDGGLKGTSDVQHTAVTTPNTAATIYLVPVTNDDGTVKEGCFYIKVVTATAEKYFNVDVSADFSGLYAYLHIEDAPETQYVYDATLGTLVTVADTTGGIEYVIGATKSNDFVGAQEKADAATVFVVKLVEAACTHEFAADCDAECNVCGETRDVTGVEHTAYDNACDTTCACGLIREVADHVDADGDNACDVCAIDMKSLYTERVESFKAETVVDAKMNAGTVITVKTVGGAYDSVTIVWSSDKATVATVEGVTTITMPNESGDIIITAVYTCGTYTETVEYKVSLLKVATVVSVDYLEGKPFYIYSDKWNIYMVGAIWAPSSSGKVMDSTANIGDATAFYIEKAVDAEGNAIAGEYNLYFLDESGAKNYIIMTSTSATKFDVVTSLEGALYPTWSFDATVGTFFNAGVYAKSKSNSAYLVGFYMSSKTHYDFRTAKYNFSAVATTDYAALVVINCEHVYAGDCATACGICGEARETTVAHTYDNCEDTACNVCGATREAVAHVYDNCDDTTCANCTVTREKVEHAYSSVCDATCNNCGEERTAEVCVDTDGDKKCDNEGCGKELGSDGPMTDVPVTEE